MHSEIIVEGALRMNTYDESNLLGGELYVYLEATDVLR